MLDNDMDSNLNSEYNEQNVNSENINYEPNVIESSPIKHKKKNLDLDILGLIFAFLFPIVGLVLCIISLVQKKKRGEKGSGFAIAGIFVVILSYTFPYIIMFVINNYYSYDVVKTNILKPACKMRDEEGKYESTDGNVTCEDNVCVYDDGKDRVVLTCNK